MSALGTPADRAGSPSTPQGGESLPGEVQRVADRFRSFLTAHGGTGTAMTDYLGRPGYRIVVVAVDGAFADAVVSDRRSVDAVCVSAGLDISDWTREVTSRMTVSRADRSRMAGTGR